MAKSLISNLILALLISVIIKFVNSYSLVDAKFNENNNKWKSQDSISYTDFALQTINRLNTHSTTGTSRKSGEIDKMIFNKKSLLIHCGNNKGICIKSGACPWPSLDNDDLCIERGHDLICCPIKHVRIPVDIFEA
ncbi:unnamed protein product [Leptidea sinapis]|uniref:Single domain-containing protein n=1 Tax=Leptidea sinapis TaxID=189913 RepID=A0A5E4QST2_9NEOP|nr:unnamed protein product [Leptidea sinapis]